MVNVTAKKSTRRVLPVWLMRLIGITSLATAVVGFALYWFKKNPPRRKINGGNGDASNENEHVPIATQSTNNWSNKLLGGLKARKNKKKMTVSLKNTVLWNPSPDVDTPIFAFQEKSIQILTRLSYLYDIYVIVHVSSEEEKDNIQNMLENASSSDGLFVDSGVDNRKIIFCSNEEGKVHIIRHIEPSIHVEGGWEKDDGEEIIKKLKPFVSKLVWIMTKRRRDSFRPENVKEEDKAVLGQNVEISDLLINTSIAHEVRD